MRTKKIFWTLLVIVLIALFAGRGWWLYNHRETDDSVVRVGVLSFLSGQYAEMGQDMTNGIILAKDELNASNPGFKIELIIEDGKAKAKDSVNAFNKLLFQDIQASIVTGDNQVPAVAPLIKEHKIPTVLTIIGNNEFLKYNQPETVMYKNYPQVSEHAQIFAKWILKNEPIKSVALLSVKTPYGDDSVHGFREGIQKEVNVTIHETFSGSALDVKTPVVKVLATQPDAIFLTGYGSGYVAAINEIRQQGFKGKIFTDGSVKNPENKNRIKSFQDLIFFSHLSLEQNLSPMVKNFVSKYQEKFHKEPSDYATCGYSSMMLLAEAIKQAHDKNPVAINEALRTIRSFETLYGNLTLHTDGLSSLPVMIGKMNPDGSFQLMEIVKE